MSDTAEVTPVTGTPSAPDVARYLRRLDSLVSDRMQHENVWSDCYDHSFPLRGSGLQNSSPLTAQTALDRMARLVDSTATDGGQILASSLQAGMTPASARWFGLEIMNGTKADEDWLDGCAEQLHQEIHNANFDSETGDAMLDIVVAGWFALFIDVDRDVGGFVFEAWPLAQCFPASTRADGVIDTLYRRYTLTAQQCVQEFGADVVSATVLKKSQESPDERVELLHVIEPRTDYVKGGRQAKNMPFASCKMERETRHALTESGFHEFPLAVPRWRRIPQTPYAVGPMFDALPDARMLNKLKKLDYAAADIAVSGMWVAVDDGVLNPRTIKIGARKVIVASSIDSIKGLETSANWQLADARIASLQQSIRKMLMADQLQAQDGPAMTATEIHARVALIRQQLGPVFGRMQAEYLLSLIERCFNLAFRAGIFPPAPDSMANRAFSVKYLSPLARAQKLEDVTAIQNTVSWVLQVAPLVPAVLDRYDWDDMAEKLGQGNGVPSTCIRDMKAVMALRDARKQQQAAQQDAAQSQNLQSMAAQEAFKGAQARATASSM